MRTGGYGNDGLIVLIPVGVLLAVGVMLFGGPAETLDAINRFVGDTARATVRVVAALFS
jgi:hypothetical protein